MLSFTPKYNRNDPRTKLTLPPIRHQVTNLTKAITGIGQDILAGKPILVSEDIRKQREAICKACEFYKPDEERCSKCGCCTSGLIINKLKYASQTCPLTPPKWSVWSPQISVEASKIASNSEKDVVQ